MYLAKSLAFRRWLRRADRGGARRGRAALSKLRLWCGFVEARVSNKVPGIALEALTMSLDYGPNRPHKHKDLGTIQGG